MAWNQIYTVPQNVLMTESGLDLLTEDGDVLLVEQDLTPAWGPINDSQTPNWTPVVT